ncbi:MAG: hypothetical protein AM326_06545 [Candidatus Thorarchaeota archaeon SMTZ-45]|nr:MAG: hypothetical protein AM326_06545 [Candidatus Thorarchaeota archaeon SMTZ-45]
MSDDKPAVSIKDMLKREPILSSGHRMCAGCAAPTVIKLMGMALRGPTIVCNNTGCLEVATTIYPYTAWEIPWIHVAFENAAAVASGAIEAINAMRAKGRYKHEHVDVIALGGDGSSFDIGFGAIGQVMQFQVSSSVKSHSLKLSLLIGFRMSQLQSPTTTATSSQSSEKLWR